MRLATWGTAAAIALLIAVLTATTDIGTKRLANSVAKSSERADPPPVAVPVPDPAQVARLAETENETRRLSEAIRTLSSDRERLLERIASLERNLDDVTGSIQRQAQPRAPPAPPPDANAAPPAGPETSGASETTGTVDRPPNAEAETPKPEATPQPALGIDIGGAVSFDRLRALWRSIGKAHPDLVEGLHPIVAVRENPRTRNAELRLVAGPLPDAEAAEQLCAMLGSTRRHCQPATFEGQELMLSVPAPVRRPPAERKPSRAKANP
ncbi:MAG: hypothetical protein ACRECO_10405 [Xanthobacteraceae bacterium]